MAWSKTAAASIVDMGGPLGKSLRVTKGGSSPTTNDLGGYSILQAESKEALAATMNEHPQFMIGDGAIEIAERSSLGAEHARKLGAERAQVSRFKAGKDVFPTAKLAGLLELLSAES